MTALYVFGYFSVGLALFFAFWRWAAWDDDYSGNNVVSCMLLFLWPLTLLLLAFILLMCWLLDCGKKVMKK